MEEGVGVVDGVEAPRGVDRHLAVRVPAEDEDGTCSGLGLRLRLGLRLGLGRGRGLEEDGTVGRGRCEAEARVGKRAHLVRG